MSFLGTMFTGISTLLGYAGKVEKRPYTKIRLYGDAKFDDLHVLDYEYNFAEISNLDVEVEESYGANTILLAQFDSENLSAGNLINVSEPIEKWEFYRKEVGIDILSYLGEVEILDPSIKTEFVDISAAKNKTYEYVVFGITENEITESLTSEESLIDYYCHVFINPETNETYLFNLNTETTSITNETDINRYDGYNKYSAYSFGKRDFEVGSITAVIGDISIENSNLTQPIEKLNELRSFINNGKEKIYKNPKGEVFRVITRDSSRTLLNQWIKEQPYVVSLRWEERERLV